MKTMEVFHQSTVVRSHKLRIKNKFKSVAEETENVVALMRANITKFSERVGQVVDNNDGNFFELCNKLNNDIEKYQEKIFLMLAEFECFGDALETPAEMDEEHLCDSDLSAPSIGHQRFSPSSLHRYTESNRNSTHSAISSLQSPYIPTSSVSSIHSSERPISLSSSNTEQQYEDCCSIPDQETSRVSGGSSLLHLRALNSESHLTNSPKSLYRSAESCLDSRLDSASNVEDCSKTDLAPLHIPQASTYVHAEHVPPVNTYVFRPISYSLPRPKPLIVPPKISIPSTVSASLGHVTSPEDFWLELENREGYELNFPLSQFSQDESPQSVEIDDYVLAPFKSVSHYWRAKVLTNVSDDREVDVFFIDQGSVQTLPTYALRILPKHLYKIPAQAIHCCLADISPINGAWTEESIKKLKDFENNSLDAYIKSYLCGKYEVQLSTAAVSLFGEDIVCSMADLLCDYDLAIPNESSNDKQDHPENTVSNCLSHDSGVSVTFNHSSRSTHSFSCSSGSSLESGGSCKKPGSVSRDIGSNPAASRDLMSFDSIEQIKPALSTGSDVSFNQCRRDSDCSCDLHLVVPPLAVSCIEKDMMVVMLSHVVSPGEFYVNLAMEGSIALDELQDQMNSTYRSNSNLQPVTFHDLEEGMYLAGPFKEDGNWYRVKVLKVNSEVLGLLSFYPDSARDCDVSVQYIDYGNCAQLKYSDLRPLLPQFAKPPAFSIRCSLAGIVPKCNRISDGALNPSWDKEAAQKFKQLISFDRCLTAEIYKLPSSRSSACDVNGFPLQVWLWDNKGTEDILINRLLVDCDVARLEDCLMTTSKQKSNVDEESLTLVSDEKSLDHWDPMKEEFCSIENSYGVHKEDGEMALVGYKPNDESYICKYFSLRGYCPRGDYCDKEHVGLAEGGVTRDRGVDYALENTPQLPQSSSYVLVQVSAVVSPGHFYCILPFGDKSVQEIGSMVVSGYCKDPWPKDQFNTLVQAMNKHYNEASFEENTMLALSYGSIVAAKREADGLWHRGRVTEVTGVAESSKIFFVDFGDASWVPRKFIRGIQNEFLYDPFQAIECHLSDVEPLGSEAGKKWSPHSFWRFKDMVANQVLLAHITYKVGDILHLTLRLTKETCNEHCNISEILLREGFAQHRSICVQTDEKETSFVPG